MKTILEVEEAQMRIIAAIDEIYFCAEQIAANMGIATNYEEASNAFDNIACRIDDMPMDIENIRGDAETSVEEKE